MSLEPIHKFNGGRGATLCHECRVIIREGLTEDLYCEEHGGRPWKYKLVRESDGLTKKGDTVFWIEWNEDRTFKNKYEEPAVGRSLIVDGNKYNYTWLTTTIKEILEQKENFISFTTENSCYKLYINELN